MVEFALTVPLLVTILMFSMFITDIARVKLKMQEASRYAAWEMTSHLLTDFGSHDHDGAFNVAMQETLKDVKERYKDLDSVEDNAGTESMIFKYGQLNVTLENQQVALISNPALVLGGGGGFFSDMINAVNGGVSKVIDIWGFNPKGQVQARVEMEVENKFLPKGFLDGVGGMYNTDHHGGVNLAKLKMHNRFAMIASGWHLADGADQTVSDKTNTAGDHNDGSKGGMWSQVDQMTYLGLKNAAQSKIGGLADVAKYFPIPQFWETFVVSHNYGLEDRPERQPGGGPHGQHLCNVETRRAGGYNGLHNMATDKGSHPRLLKGGSYDDYRMRCFDTAPFRDQAAHEKSLYRDVFMARGEWFMGCQNQMADDPVALQTYKDDKHKDKRVCANQQQQP